MAGLLAGLFTMMTGKKRLIAGFMVLAVMIALIVNGIRFMGLDKTPPGGHVDEVSYGVLLQCISSEGIDAGMDRPRLYNYPGYSYDYILPGSLWVKMFGFSVTSMRAFSVLFVVLGLIGVVMLARRFWGWECAMWAALVASVCPWLWPVSRIGYESQIALPFFVWALVFFFRSNRWSDMVIAGFLLAVSAYAYPPFRMNVPLMLLPIFLLKWKFHGIKLWPTVIFLGVLTVTVVPLIARILDGSVSRYFNNISIFSPAFLASQGKTSSLPDLLGLFWKYYSMHLDPVYLFLKGGGTVMYMTGYGGLFGPVEIVGILGAVAWLLRGLWKNGNTVDISSDMFWGFVLILGFLIGILPVAFTQYNVPNVLRTIAAWPFAVLFVSFFLWRWSSQWRGLGIAMAFLGAVFMAGYLHDYFLTYSERNKMDFGISYKELAMEAKSTADWAKFVVACGGDGMKARYYLMQYGGASCTQANQFYMTISDKFKTRGW